MDALGRGHLKGIKGWILDNQGGLSAPSDLRQVVLLLFAAFGQDTLMAPISAGHALGGEVGSACRPPNGISGWRASVIRPRHGCFRRHRTQQVGEVLLPRIRTPRRVGWVAVVGWSWVASPTLERVTRGGAPRVSCVFQCLLNRFSLGEVG